MRTMGSHEPLLPKCIRLKLQHLYDRSISPKQASQAEIQPSLWIDCDEAQHPQRSMAS